jgi:hypothetical protein
MIYPGSAPRSGGKGLVLPDYIDVYLIYIVANIVDDGYGSYGGYGGYEDE